MLLRVESSRRHSYDKIWFDNQPINWIKRHRSFASREWIDSQVKYNTWTPQRNSGHFIIITYVSEGVSYLKVFIHIVKVRRQVTVRHCHGIRRRK